MTATVAGLSLARREDRFFAALVDGLFFWMPITLLGLFQRPLGLDPHALLTNLLSALLLGGPMVTQLVLVARNGQSLGKRLFGIRVVHPDGSRVSLWRMVFLRNVLPFVLSFACGPTGLIDALCIFRDSRRCLHDELAGTLVIDVRARAQAVVPVAAAL